jgi:hypothetical protein
MLKAEWRELIRSIIEEQKGGCYDEEVHNN